MKTLIVKNSQLSKEGRWDIDYHLPPEGIKRFSKEILVPIAKCADIVKSKKDPTKTPNLAFQYIDIASIDVETGLIVRPQEMTGEEAPSRARKLVSAFDIVISTVRPTRGAIAVIPESLHGEICSTGFSVIRAKENVNPYYLHFAIRLDSTLEQFRKWSTGSSYPAILDSDVEKTLIPLPSIETQDKIANEVRTALIQRQEMINKANQSWTDALKELEGNLIDEETWAGINSREKGLDKSFTLAEVKKAISKLPELTQDESSSVSGLTLEEFNEDTT